MGGSPNLLMPVSPTYTASWASHTRRSPRSSEPGTDMFVPIGTPVYAPGDGSIYGSGSTIGPATGRWVGIDLDNGLRFRCMHLSRLKRTTGHVRRGELLGYSGASGYGYEDWSHLPGMPAAHTHVTLWPTQVSRYGYDRNGEPFSVDFMQYVGGTASGGSTNKPAPAPIILKEFKDMDKAVIIHKVEGAVTTYMLAGATVPGGYRVTNVAETAGAWAEIYGDSKKVSAKRFGTVQAEAKALASSWLAQQKAIRG